MNTNTILIVDDESEIRRIFRTALNKKNFETIEASDGKEALKVYTEQSPDIVLLDLQLPDIEGHKLLQEMKKINHTIPIIIITAYGTINSSVKAVKSGAYDYIPKPPDLDSLLLSIRRALEKSNLQKKVKTSLELMLGKSQTMKEILTQIQQVAPSNLSILLQGPTGVGKTTLARIIHNLSKRSEKPFVAINMGAISESLAESELFGREEGAYTGASESGIGYFETAKNGTLFLDELESTPPHLQNKMLTAVEEKKITRLGSTQSINIDIRIITATNDDIIKNVKEKKFREDLFYRLNEFPIIIPSLKERREDITSLIYHFVDEASKELDKYCKDINDEAIHLLQNHSWPGNIRELKNVIKRALVVSEDSIIQGKHIKFLINNTNSSNNSSLTLKEVTKQATIEAERSIIIATLIRTKGIKTKAAGLLGVDYKTLLTKIKNYEISTSN